MDSPLSGVLPQPGAKGYKCKTPVPEKPTIGVCERSVGTVFQLPSPDAIYSRDEEKNGNMGGLPDCLGSRTAHVLLRKEW
jgi:hypothetical protein